MPVPPESVQIGRRYMTAKGRTRRVVAIEADKVTFYEGQQVAIGREWPRRMVAKCATFAANAVSEVPCPPKLSHPAGYVV